MSAPLRRVLLRRPSRTGDFLAADWRQPDTAELAAQHDAFAALLESLGCEVSVAPALDGLVDSCYIRDPALVTARGAVLFQMAKPVRRTEPDALADAFAAAGVPVLARLEGDAFADGGDMVWLDSETLLVGRSYRTNAAAVATLRAVLSAEGVRVESVDLPHDRGPEHVLHLMSVLSPIADDLAVVHPPLVPVPLMEDLAARSVTLVEVDPGEYATLGCNVLATRPREVVLAGGNPRTRAALERHGCTVHEYPASEISVKGDGGPTCLTQPLWRA
ncbi:MAG TPA: arginine deiminase family protein [Micromonosporaceae bacterium]|nr:arginine deiminase family protein [Micromonosporaceae bacterium]